MVFESAYRNLNILTFPISIKVIEWFQGFRTSSGATIHIASACDAMLGCLVSNSIAKMIFKNCIMIHLVIEHTHHLFHLVRNPMIVWIPQKIEPGTRAGSFLNHSLGVLYRIMMKRIQFSNHAFHSLWS
jgi:hypothetical protein